MAQYNNKTHIVLMAISLWALMLSQSVWASTLTENTTIPVGDHRYTENLIVPNGVTLTIEAGAVLTFSNGNLLHVKEGGKLFVNGTDAEPVTFTSDGLTANSWSGIYFEGARADNSELVIDHAVIEYADKALYTNKAGVKVAVTNSVVRYNNYGVYIDGAYQSAPNHPMISFSAGALHDNYQHNFYTKNFYGTTVATVNARGNWWGTADVSAIQETIFDLQDGAYKPIVDFSGLLTSENGNVLAGTHTLGLIAGDVVVSASDTVFLQPVRVLNGGSLSVSAGTRLALDDNAAILIEDGGKFFVQGTAAEPVVFTHAAGVANSWQGIRFEGARADNSELVIDHAIIEYADKALYTNKAGVKVAVTNSVVRYNNYGVYIDGAYQSAPNHPMISFSAGALHDNYQHNFYTKNFYGTTVATVNARGNWWGTADVSAIQETIFDLQDGAYKPIVDFSGLLTSENGNVLAGTHTLGLITGDVVVSASDTVFLQPVRVLNGGSLSVSAGTRLALDDNTAILIEDGGKFFVQGTAAEPVVFTHAAGVANSWQGIRFEGARADNSELVIDHAIIEYADKALYTNKAGVKVAVTNSVVRYNNYGVYIDGAYQSAPNHPMISFSAGALHDNYQHNFYTKNFYGTTVATVNARGNWWGTADVSAIQETIFDLQDGAYKPIVDFSGLLTSENGNVLAGTHTLGLITGDVVVSASDTVFLQPVRVLNGGSLSVSAGTRLALDDNTAILIEDGGKFFVQGTAAEPVVFTHAAGVANSWQGIRFEGARADNSELVIDHAIIEYADKALYTNKAGVKVAVTNSVVRYNNYGVYIDGAYQSAPNHPMISYSAGALHDNYQHNFYTKNFYGTTVATVNARGNWWGTADVSAIQETIFDLQDSTYKPIVDFSHFLTSENGNPLPGTHILGRVNGENRWQFNDGLVLADTRVRPGANVIVEAGSRLSFLGNAKLIIEDGATFSVVGESNNPVTFTSGKTEKVAGDWAGIEIKSNNNIHISNAVIEYANKGIYFDGLKASGVITNSLIQHNNYGVFVNGGSQAFANHPVPIVTNNTFQNNVNYDYYAEKFGSASSRTLNARGNYWGTTDTTIIASKVYDNADYSQSPIVDYGFARHSQNSAIIADAGDDLIGFGTVKTELTGAGSSSSEITTYAWQQYLGSSVMLNHADTAIADFTTEDVTSDERKSFIFMVTDANNISASDKLNVVIKPFSEYNQAPSVAESQELLVSANENVVVTLSALDDDNDPLSYVWQQISGNTVVLDNMNTDTLSFIAPSADTNQIYTFKLVVSDGNYDIERTVVIAVKKPETTAGTYYYHNDHLGTPQVMTDISATVVWQANYTPFGKADIIVNTVTNNIRFPGQYYDEESGLHYNYFRDYDPELGRYIQSDPIGLAGGINTYGYVYGNPIMYYDPYGLYGMDDVWGAVYWATDGWTPSNSTVNFAAGFGDSLSFNLTKHYRHSQNICSVDYNDSSYGNGNTAGAVFGLANAGRTGLVVYKNLSKAKKWRSNSKTSRRTRAKKIAAAGTYRPSASDAVLTLVGGSGVDSIVSLGNGEN